MIKREDEKDTESNAKVSRVFHSIFLVECAILTKWATHVPKVKFPDLSPGLQEMLIYDF